MRDAQVGNGHLTVACKSKRGVRAQTARSY